MSDEFIYATDDEDWSRRVKDWYGGYCAWPGCETPSWGCGAHHSVPRRFKETRLIVQAGVYLCQKHHNKIESLPKSGWLYRRLMELFIGKEMYRRLNDLLSTSSLLQDTDPDSGKQSSELRMPSSEDIDTL